MAATGRHRDPLDHGEEFAGDSQYASTRDTYAPNGVQRPEYPIPRAGSQRQRKSGDGIHDATGPIYEAPDSPTALEGQYQTYAGEEYGPNTTGSTPSSRSFAARAGAIPAQANTALARSDSRKVPPISAPQQHLRRRSDGQADPIDYPKPRQPSSTSRSASIASGGPTRGISNSSDTRPREWHDRSNAKKDPDASGRRIVSVPVRSATMSSSVTTPTDWAADRSPLQKLEVKLNDISKEEKRARVQLAEQRLRESKAASASQQTSQGVEPSKQRQDSRRAVSDSNQFSNGRTRDLDGSVPDEYPAASLARRNISNASQGYRQAAQSSGGPKTAEIAPTPTARRPSLTNRGLDQGRPMRSLDGNRGEERAVRFHDDTENVPDSPRHERRPVQTSRQNDSQNVAIQRSDSIQADSQGISVAPRVPANTQHAFKHDRHLKHQLPPQTAAGVRARQQIGFERDITGPIDLPSDHKHHLPGFLHRQHNQQPEGGIGAANVQHLEEWRDAQTVRLTLEDATALAIPPPKPAEGSRNVAWWEESPSQRQRRRSTAEADFTALDGAQEDINGMRSPVSISHRRTSIATARDVDGPVRARQYIGYEGTSRAERRNRSWLRRPRSIIKLRLGNHVSRTLTFEYSYACAALSEHDPSVGNHICYPYVSKELMKTMRAIRVRPPIEPTVFTPPLLLKCGPLLRYTGMRRNTSASGQPGRETWRGSVMIVTTDSKSVYEPAPTLRLFHQPMELLPPPPTHFDEAKDEDLPSEYIDPVGGLPKMTRTGGTIYVKPAEDLDPGKDVSMIEDDDGLYEVTRTANVPTKYGKADELLGRSPLPSLASPRQRKPTKAGRFREVKGIRLHAERGVTFWRFNLEVELGDEQTRVAYRINKGASIGFWVPAKGQTMNIMFHSCNGFSMSVDPNLFSGPDPLWRDVLNTHQMNPFHVMIGGGDQIYNDAVMRQTRLFQDWLDIKNPHEKHKAEFTVEMQEELETFYLERYSMWFSQGLFGMANSQIPMLNIWDDHDIIDGFGSYPDSLMSTPVFCGLGNIAFKYYMLFQHQSVADELEADEPSWLLGSAPGPYISSLSRSVFVSLGKRVAFVGIDCRTERTRDEIVSESTYDAILDRCDREIIRGETQHLIVLLGVPIAYPRLVWLENVLTSRALDPLKALGRMGMLGNFMNKFDGGVEILDDLDDHWTAKNHKEERNWFVEELQHLAAEKSVRITILGGDVHLAAIGQFYSNKALKIAKDKDHRYMPNIISSAIVNTPPPDVMADVLNRRNKIHHLNPDTDEDMIPMFTHDVDGKPRNNKHLLPKRNWCSITEYVPGSTPPPTPPSLTPTASEESVPPKPQGPLQRTLSLGGRDSKPAKLIRRLSLSQRQTSYVDQSPSPPPERLQPDPTREPNNTQNEDDDPPQSRFVTVPLPTRPISHFHRRATDISEKAAAKGGAEDGHVNLEYGLDIRLNCEIKQGDPSGVTEGYRLLVPALFYGEEYAPSSQRRPSLIRRLTNAGRSMTSPRHILGSFRQSDDGNGSSIDAANREVFGIAPAADYGAAATRPPVDIPVRGPSLLKKPLPFLPRPKAASVSGPGGVVPGNSLVPASAPPAQASFKSMISAPIPLEHNPFARMGGPAAFVGPGPRSAPLQQRVQPMQQQQHHQPMQQPRGQTIIQQPQQTMQQRGQTMQQRDQQQMQRQQQRQFTPPLQPPAQGYERGMASGGGAAGDAASDPEQEDDEEEDEDEDEDEDSLLMEDLPPKSSAAAARRRSKFDASGTSKFFGAGAPIGGPPPPGPAAVGATAYEDNEPMSWASARHSGGIPEKKGWRKFF